MDQITAGLTILFNGGLEAAQAAFNWAVLLGVVSAVSLIWLARLEIDETDKRGAKPNVMRH